MGTKRGDGRLSAADEAEARDLYESGAMTMAAIGARYGVSKNVIVGLANRHWGMRRPADGVEPETLFDRMDRLEASMNEVLRLYPPGTGLVPAVRQTAAEKRAAARDWAHR